MPTKWIFKYSKAHRKDANQPPAGNFLALLASPVGGKQNKAIAWSPADISKRRIKNLLLPSRMIHAFQSIMYFLSPVLLCMNSFRTYQSFQSSFPPASTPLRMWSPASMCTTQSGTWPLIRWNSFTPQWNIEILWGSQSNSYNIHQMMQWVECT